ncbi:MAG TPA: DUF3857 domain-containing protein [Ferruginibacter sp.]|nr:DUF3857 domain-containing protein [Ferruginibacter sp.]
MIKCFASLFFFMLCTYAHAQHKTYSALSVPGELKKNAHSVVRDELIAFEVRSPDKAFYNVHKVITILNEAGKDELYFTFGSDKFRSVEDISIAVLDGMGLVKNTYSKADFGKQSNLQDLVPDGKIYFLEIPSNSYPLSLVIDFKIKFNGLLNYPAYQVQLPAQAVENSEFTAKVPIDLDLRYKPRNTSLTPVVRMDGKYKIYTWTAKNLPALETEEGAVEGESYFPHVQIAPNKFELDGYEGDMSTWKSFGYWYGSLTKTTSNLTDDRKLFFQSLVKNATDDIEKARIIYKYLQDNFRYVSIQLGIGGFKPFDANFVDKKKYGDCKALSNYTQACLSAVGVQSYQALIYRSSSQAPLDPDFPRSSFNHVILCIPQPKDSIWLECTSTTNDFAVLGSSTENRNALLITEDGGKLVATPKSRASENTLSVSSSVELGEEGSGLAKVSLHTDGEYRQYFIHYVLNETKDEQKKFIVNRMGFIHPDEFELNYDKANRDAATNLTMKMEKIPEFSTGSKMFLSPRIYKFWNYALPKAENRTQDFYFEHPMIQTDTTTYILPNGFVPETLPKAKNLKFEYGSFNTSYRYDEKKKAIITTAKLVLDEHKIPVAKFLETKKFFNEVLEEYTQKIIIKRS